MIDYCQHLWCLRVMDYNWLFITVVMLGSIILVGNLRSSNPVCPRFYFTHVPVRQG